MGTAGEGPAATVPGPPAGGWHEAVPCSSTSELAARMAPRVGAAVAAGDPVVAVLTDDGRDALRHLLGDGAREVDFQDPAEVHRVPGFTVATRWARTSRRITTPGGRALVVGQQLDDLPGCGPEHWARLDMGLDVAIAGLPVTVLCPFPADSPNLRRIRATHPVLATGDGHVPSTTYRPPHEAVVDYPPPPPPDLGPPAAELVFDLAHLSELRHLVTVVAASGGLRSELVADVVLAVNELASNSVEHGPGAGRLRMWTADGVIAEVSDGGRLTVPFPGMALPPPEGSRGRGLWLASELSDVMQVWSGESGTVVRIRTGG